MLDTAMAEKQFAFTGTTHRYVDFDGNKILMDQNADIIPTPYSTMPLNVRLDNVDQVSI